MDLKLADTKRMSDTMEAKNEPDYRAILFELLDDLLSIQIDTLMFWRSEDEMEPFAHYAKFALRNAARQAKWGQGA
jgi:hypothetical protein